LIGVNDPLAAGLATVEATGFAAAEAVTAGLALAFAAAELAAAEPPGVLAADPQPTNTTANQIASTRKVRIMEHSRGT
jgi:hypothetical protein